MSTNQPAKSDASVPGYRHKPFGLGEGLAAAILRRAVATGRADELIGCLIDGGMATVDTESHHIYLAPPSAFGQPDVNAPEVTP